METDYSDTVAGLLQGDTLAPYIFIICLEYVHRTFIDKMKKKNSFSGQRKEAVGTLHKQLPMPTTPMM